jgi:Eukaryotic-type carbonic anhydrase
MVFVPVATLSLVSAHVCCQTCAAGVQTTPPCSEGLRWHVFKEPMTISVATLIKLEAKLSGTNDPLQPLPYKRPLPAAPQRAHGLQRPRWPWCARASQCVGLRSSALARVVLVRTWTANSLCNSLVHRCGTWLRCVSAAQCTLSCDSDTSSPSGTMAKLTCGLLACRQQVPQAALAFDVRRRLRCGTKE